MTVADRLRSAYRQIEHDLEYSIIATQADKRVETRRFLERFKRSINYYESKLSELPKSASLPRFALYQVHKVISEFETSASQAVLDLSTKLSKLDFPEYIGAKPGNLNINDLLKLILIVIENDLNSDKILSDEYILLLQSIINKKSIWKTLDLSKELYVLLKKCGISNTESKLSIKDKYDVDSKIVEFSEYFDSMSQMSSNLKLVSMPNPFIED